MRNYSGESFFAAKRHTENSEKIFLTRFMNGFLRKRAKGVFFLMKEYPSRIFFLLTPAGIFDRRCA